MVGTSLLGRPLSRKFMGVSSSIEYVPAAGAMGSSRGIKPNQLNETPKNEIVSKTDEDTSVELHTIKIEGKSGSLYPRHVSRATQRLPSWSKLKLWVVVFHNYGFVGKRDTCRWFVIDCVEPKGLRFRDSNIDSQDVNAVLKDKGIGGWAQHPVIFEECEGIWSYWNIVDKARPLWIDDSSVITDVIRPPDGYVRS